MYSLKLRCAVSAAALILAIAAPFGRASEAQRILEDSESYFTAPLRWDAEDWSWFGAAAAITALSTTADKPVRDHFAPGPLATHSMAGHDLRDALPVTLLTVGTFVAARMASNKALESTSYRMVEAVGLATISSAALKYVAGRQRPDASLDSHRWFSGGDAFPSGHVAAAFAAATVFAESGSEPTFGRRLLAYGLATATAYARVQGDRHWLSDTVAGAALGIATGRFLLHREAQRSAVNFAVIPMNGGAMLQISMVPTVD